MNLLLMLLVVIMLSGLTSSAINSCQTQCVIKKNAENAELSKIREELDSCKPVLVECKLNKGIIKNCQEEYFACKWGKISEIREKQIEISTKYNNCIFACGIEIKNATNTPPLIQIKPKSSFCLSLEKSKVFLISSIGNDKFESMLKTYRC